MPKVTDPLAANATKWIALAVSTWVALGPTFVGCSNDPASPATGTGGSTNTQGTGGMTTTPPPSSGGATQPSRSGGASGSGGAISSGGTGTGGMVIEASGGTTATGGAGDTAAATGGKGGNSNNGGRSSGGATAAGGTAAGGTGAGGTAAGGTAAGTGGVGAGGTNHAGVWKVMPFGDSVTGSTCYPQIMSKDLIAGGHTNFQFIGTVTNNQGSCGANTPSVKTEGHGGYGVTFLPSTSTRPKCTKQAQGCGSYAELQTWAAEKPDIVLMHYATNDCWDGEPTQLILSAYVAVIAEFRKQNPNVIFFVSKIIPLTPALMNAANLNAAVTPAWAATNSLPTSPVHIIDHQTGFDPGTDTMDGVHPNPAGAQKMSTASVAALAAAAYF